MGKKLDVLLGRRRENTMTSKLITLANLAVARIAILKNQRQVMFFHAKSDVIQLLKLGHQERALLRVEFVIKDLNMVDVFIMMEHYFHSLIERNLLLQDNKECPDELKEAISSLIFASSRCSEFPELQEIRGLFVSRFGKEFAVRAVELRNNCGVNPMIIKKLSARRPSLESRMELLKDIASENGVVLRFEDVPAIAQEKMDVSQQQQQEVVAKGEFNESANLDDTGSQSDTRVLFEQLNTEEQSPNARKKYKDVAAAALEAFESAAYAATAARAAVELSMSESWDSDQDDRRGCDNGQETGYDFDESLTTPETGRYEASEAIEQTNDRISTADSDSSESEHEDTEKHNRQMHLKESELESRKMKPAFDRTPSTSSSDSDGGISLERNQFSDSHSQNEPGVNQMVSYLIDKKAKSIPSPKHHNLESYRTPNFHSNENEHIRQYNAVHEKDAVDEDENNLPYRSLKWIPQKPHYRTPNFHSNENEHIRQYNAVHEKDAVDEDENNLPYRSLKWIPQKPHANTIEGKYEFKSAHHENSVEQLNSNSRVYSQHLSVRTRRAPRP